MNASGYTYLLLLPPPGKAYPYTSVVSGRPYVAATQYTMVSVPNFDAAVLTANGWLTVPPGVQIASDDYAGVVEPDGTTITVTDEGVISSVGGGGGGSTITRTADTDIAAGTSVSVNGSGHAVQTWGPAPQIAGTATLFGGAVTDGTLTAISLGPSSFVAANDSLGLQAGSINGGVVSVGAVEASAVSKAIATITYGANNGNFQAVGLTSTSFVAAYNDPTTGNLNVVVATIDGSNDLEYGTARQVANTPGAFGFAAAIIAPSSTKFVLTYTDGSGAVWAVAGSVSGSSITLGTPVELTTAGQGAVIVELEAASVLIGYQDGNVSNELSLVQVGITGTALTPSETPFNISADESQPAGLAALTSSSAVLWGVSENLYAVEISGATINVGSGVNVNTAAQGAALYVLNSTTVMGWYTTQNFLATVSGLDLDVALQAFLFPPGDLGGLGNTTGGKYPNFFGTAAVGLAGDLAIVANINFSIFETNAEAVLSSPVNHQFLTGYWLYTLGTTALATLLDINGVAYARVITPNPINNGPIGFVNSAVSEGGTATIQTSGIVPDLTDQAGDALTPGTTYYHNGDGSIVTANTGHKAGLALTSSSLLIQ
jgi:hypothetical protein